jgi:hypothetical protein
MGYDPFGKLRVSEDLGADAVVLPVLVTQIQFRVRACLLPTQRCGAAILKPWNPSELRFSCAYSVAAGVGNGSLAWLVEASASPNT